MYLYLSLALTVSAGIGFGYGLFRFFREKSALYVKMIVFGVGCAMLGRLFETLLYVVNVEVTGDFHVGMLGTIGSFLFFFSANYGQMDSLVDDGTPKFRKTRIIALAAPLVMLAFWLVFVVLEGFNSATISLGIVMLFAALASYFHLKHLIIKDVNLGLIQAIRKYNLLALVYVVLCMLEMAIAYFAFPAFCAIIVCVLECAVFLALVPVLERGVKKWTI